MKKYFLLTGVFGVMAMLLSSCATMFSGTTQQVAFNSEPQGAAVNVNHRQTLCVTPCVVSIQRSSSSIVTFTKDSYKKEDIVLQGTFNPTTIWNVVLGGIPGIAIDAISGAIWQYNYPSVHAKLTPENYVQQSKNQAQPSKVEAGKNDKLKVAVLAPTATADVPESMKSIVLEEANSAVANTFGYTTLTSEPADSASTDISQVCTFGKKIGADKVFLTHISKLGDAYHVSCKFVDVATSGIDSQKTGKTVSGGANIDDVVIDMVVTMLRQY